MTKRISGTCLAKCGKCCQVLALPIPDPDAYRLKTTPDGDPYAVVPMPTNATAEWLHFLATRGVELTPNGRHALVPLDDEHDPAAVSTYADAQLPILYLRSTCPHLAQDARCDLYGRPDRPQVCQEWPTPQDDLRSVAAFCGYTIEATNGE